MRLFIAEKPELARAISEGISGNLIKENGYMIKGDNIITHSFGHILELCEPEIYDSRYKMWNLNLLPIVIDEFKYTPKDSAKAQLKIILNLIKDSKVTEIIHCGDADEEGQILIDEIINYSKTTKPILRCLINDITPQAIKKAIEQMKPNSDFKGISESGFARSQADFIVGINLTRLYTILNRNNTQEKGVISVGRVQTPILALIVNRELDFKNHKAQDYFNVSGKFSFENSFKITAPLKRDEKIIDENEALKIKSLCENKKVSINLKSDDKLEYPPLPFNLLKLQIEASKLYGLNPDTTLKITQSLRETHKAITYNRSDCEYLPESIFIESKSILDAIEHNLQNDIGFKNADISIKSKAFNDEIVNKSAHYGIIPTQSRFDSTKLSKNELLIYELIAKRFCMQFYPPCKYKNHNFTFEIENEIFSTSIRENIELGFKAEFKNIDTSEVENEINFNMLKNLDSAFLELVEVKKEKTKPLPLYTMTALLKDLNQVSKYVKDEKIKALLKEKDKDKKGESGGIGTPATRSAHLQKLIDRGYINVSGDKSQKITATPKGINLIKKVDSSFTSPEITALWYEDQKEILNGNLKRAEFLNKINHFVKEIILNRSSEMSENIDKSLKCPKCENGYLREIDGKFGKFFSCSEYQNGCDYKAKSVNGKPVENQKKEINRDFPCPKCDGGFLQARVGKSKAGKDYTWYGCSNYPNCKFTCFENNGKPKIDS